MSRMDTVASLAAHNLGDPALGDVPWPLLLQVDASDEALLARRSAAGSANEQVAARRVDRVSAIAIFGD